MGAGCIRHIRILAKPKPGRRSGLPPLQSAGCFADLMRDGAEKAIPRLSRRSREQRDATLDDDRCLADETAERTPGWWRGWIAMRRSDDMETLGLRIEKTPTAALLVVATYRRN